MNTILRALRFVTFRMQCHELAVPIARELDQCRSELLAAYAEYEDALTRRLAATAEVSLRDQLVDETVLTLADELLRVVNNDRQHPRYVAVFPVSPSEAMSSTAGNRQHDFVHDVVSKLRADPTLRALGSHADRLAERQAALEHALSEREHCFSPEATAARRQSEAVEQACRAYNRSLPRLQLLYPHAPLIESMYPALPNRRRRSPTEPGSGL